MAGKTKFSLNKNPVCRTSGSTAAIIATAIIGVSVGGEGGAIILNSL